MKLRTVTIYSRVSTNKQELENQLLQLRNYCKKSQWQIYKEYTDIISGKINNRPSWKLLFEDAHKKKFDIVLFWDLSRFSRSGTLYTLQKLHELKNLNIDYVSYQEPYINTLGEFKDIVLSILSTIAKIERRQISERTKAGLKRTDKKIGRPNIPEEKIENVVNFLKEGYSYGEIQKRVKYRLGDGKLRHISLGKISQIKKSLSKKEGEIFV